MKKLFIFIFSSVLMFTFCLLGGCKKDEQINSKGDSSSFSNALQSSSDDSSESSSESSSSSIPDTYYDIVYNDINVQKVYFIGSTVSASGIIVKGTKLSDGLQYTLSGYNVDIPGDAGTLGTHTIKVSFGESEYCYDIYVVEKWIVDSDELKILVDCNYNGTISEKNDNGYYQLKTIKSALVLLKSGYDADIIKTIKIAEGTYVEKLTVEVPNVRFIGSDAEKTIISYGDCNSTAGGTDASATVTIKSAARNFIADKITFLNSYDFINGKEANKQALAFLTDSDKSIYSNCVFLGYQDTLEAKSGRQYYNNCYIAGSTDFIFGNNATAVFDSCEIVSRYTGENKSNNGYITAQKGNSGTNGNNVPIYGYVFINCSLTAEEGVSDYSVSLGRPWRADATVAFINCEMGSHIAKAAYISGVKSRYTSMSGDGLNVPENANFSEYGNTGAGSISIDEYIGDIITDFKMLTDLEASGYTLLNIFKTANGGITYQNGDWLPNG